MNENDIIKIVDEVFTFLCSSSESTKISYKDLEIRKEKSGIVIGEYTISYEYTKEQHSVILTENGKHICSHYAFPINLEHVKKKSLEVKDVLTNFEKTFINFTFKITTDFRGEYIINLEEQTICIQTDCAVPNEIELYFRDIELFNKFIALKGKNFIVWAGKKKNSKKPITVSVKDLTEF